MELVPRWPLPSTMGVSLCSSFFSASAAPRSPTAAVAGLKCQAVGKILFFFQAEDGMRGYKVTGVQTCALPIWCMFFFSSRRRYTRLQGDWSSDVCSSDLRVAEEMVAMMYRVRFSVRRASD